MNSMSETTLAELRIARAYVKLSRIPEDSSEASVSLASVGNCEIRMFRVPNRLILMACPWFWLELFYHSRKLLSIASVAMR